MNSLPASSTAVTVKQLQRDLARKYRLHAARIESYWRSFNRAQRKKCVKDGAADGAVLQHPSDTSLGNVYKFMPEWNLRDITEPGSDFLLDLLKHRATKNIFEQYCEGFNGRPGDHLFIQDMVVNKGLRYAREMRNCYSLFLDEKDYGKSFELTRGTTLADIPAFQPAIRSGCLVPQSTGELLLTRQMYILQSLVIIIDDILEEGSTTRNTNGLPKTKTGPTPSLSNPAIRAPAQNKLGLADLISAACDQRESAEEYLSLLSSEPVVLAHAVNFTFFSRPELVADDKGRMLPVHTDKYISGAFFDAVHNAIQTAAIWNYLGRLLDFLGTLPADKIYRAPVLQEISNICNLEYGRAQSFFKRNVQTASGLKLFKRMSNAYDNAGNPRVVLKGDPAKLGRGDPQLQSMLRLCQVETSASKAVDWVKKLSDLHEAHPNVREKLEEREFDSLADLAHIVSFIQDLTPAISMPTMSRKNGQAFIAKSQELEAELSQFKKDLDLLDFALPIDNLLEPGMADGALKALDEFIITKAGTKLGFLYQDLVEGCLNNLQEQYQREKAKAEQKDQGQAGYVPFPETPIRAQSPETRVEQRRQKEKTRPAHSSIFDIAPCRSEPSTVQQSTKPLVTLKVSSSAAGVFSALFTKSESRGSVNWTAFEAALAELGFSVIPKFGSVYKFCPPESMTAEKSFTVHRPHKSRIEGYFIPIFARRLTRLYGWGESTFELA